MINILQLFFVLIICFQKHICEKSIGIDQEIACESLVYVETACVYMVHSRWKVLVMYVSMVGSWLQWPTRGQLCVQDRLHHTPPETGTTIHHRALPGGGGGDRRK